MIINTKYNINDEVYIRRGKGAQKRTVLEIYTKTRLNTTTIQYYLCVRSPWNGITVEEKDVYPDAIEAMTIGGNQ